mgnify:CR=1 FL=1
MASTNDCGIREYNVEKYELINQFQFSWPVNVSVLAMLLYFMVFLVFHFLVYLRTMMYAIFVVHIIGRAVGFDGID